MKGGDDRHDQAREAVAYLATRTRTAETLTKIAQAVTSRTQAVAHAQTSERAETHDEVMTPFYPDT